MPRIQDIGAFNTARENGMAKLVPAVPRLTVGMGTCGRGNGAEALYQAFAEAIERSGAAIVLAPVGCFGACFQEPLVSVRLPGKPLVILRKVQAHDAGRILEDVAEGNLSPDLIYCKIEEWDHLTGHVRYGEAYPDGGKAFRERVERMGVVERVGLPSPFRDDDPVNQEHEAVDAVDLRVERLEEAEYRLGAQALGLALAAGKGSRTRHAASGIARG